LTSQTPVSFRHLPSSVFSQIPFVNNLHCLLLQRWAFSAFASCTSFVVLLYNLSHVYGHLHGLIHSSVVSIFSLHKHLWSSMTTTRQRPNVYSHIQILHCLIHTDLFFLITHYLLQFTHSAFCTYSLSSAVFQTSFEVLWYCSEQNRF
jgi:hypothetical protein